MEDFVGVLAAIALIVVVVCLFYFTGKGNAIVEERLLVCEAIGYDDYSQKSCVQAESEGVQVYVSYELVLEGLNSNDD